MEVVRSSFVLLLGPPSYSAFLTVRGKLTFYRTLVSALLDMLMFSGFTSYSFYCCYGWWFWLLLLFGPKLLCNTSRAPSCASVSIEASAG